MQLPDFLTRDPDGFIHVTGHRVGLQHLLHYYNEGYSPEMLLCEYPSLSLAVIYKVIGFYLDHEEDVDAYIEGCREESERQRQAAPPGPTLAGLRKRLAVRRQVQGA